MISTMQSRMAFHLQQSSCLTLPDTGITDMNHEGIMTLSKEPQRGQKTVSAHSSEHLPDKKLSLVMRTSAGIAGFGNYKELLQIKLPSQKFSLLPFKAPNPGACAYSLHSTKSLLSFDCYDYRQLCFCRGLPLLSLILLSLSSIQFQQPMATANSDINLRLSCFKIGLVMFTEDSRRYENL